MLVAAWHLGFGVNPLIAGWPDKIPSQVRHPVTMLIKLSMSGVPSALKPVYIAGTMRWCDVACVPPGCTLTASNNGRNAPLGYSPFLKCRVMPTHIGTLINDVSTLTDMLQALTRTVSALKKQYDTEVQTRDQAYLKLTEENATLRERIAAMHTEKSETQWQNFPKPHGTLLLGTGIIRDIDEKKLVGTKCECIRGGVIKDIQGAVDALPQNTKFARAILVAGGNDCDSVADTHEVTDILARYQDLISNTKARAFEVSVSSICQRRKSDDVTQSIKDMNAGLCVICADLGVNFIDNDPAFHLQDGSINDGYLLPDGVHLSRAATNKLASNLRLHLHQGETIAHRDHRKRSDTPATPPWQSPAAQTATQTGAEGPTGADDCSNPFWNRAHHKANKRFGQPAPSPNRPPPSPPPPPPPPHTHTHTLSLSPTQTCPDNHAKRKLSTVPHWKTDSKCPEPKCPEFSEPSPSKRPPSPAIQTRTFYGNKYIPTKTSSGKPTFWQPMSTLLGLGPYCSDMP